MKISEAEVFSVSLKEEKNWSLNPVILRLRTDEGITGLGEVGLAYGTGSSAAVGIVKDMVEEFVIGVDPFRVEYTWNLLYRQTFWGQGGGPVIYGGMSAIDEALLDIKGKVLNVPIYELLGGLSNDRLRLYANGWYYGCIKLEEYAQAATKVVENGYSALKFDPFAFESDGVWRYPQRELDPTKAKNAYDRVKQVRSAVGPDVDILIEVHGNLGVKSAIQMGKRLEEFAPFFYEEPVDAMNVECMKKVSQNVNIPIAAGERLYTRYGFRQYIEAQVLDILQPDIGLVGGITEAKKIADYADTYDIHVQPHNCASPVATAAAVQLDAAIPNFVIQEWFPYRSSRYYALVKEPLEHRTSDGYFVVTDCPGLGIELDDAVMHDFPCVKIS